MISNRDETKEKNKEDKKVSIVIMSIFVVLIAQYFIISYFNVEGQRMGQNIQLLSKVIVALLFIYSFPIVIKRSSRLFIITYCLSATVFSIAYILFQQNAMYLNDVLFKYFFICLPSFGYSFSINDRRIFSSVMDKMALVVFVIGTVFGMLVFTKKITMSSYSMPISYYMLLPTLVYTRKFLEQHTVRSLLFVIIAMLIMLALGSRGAILCTGAYIILYILINAKKASVESVLTNMGILIFIIIMAVYMKDILLFINDLLNKVGLYSRSINLFLRDEVYLSGRDDLYKVVISQIKEHPFLGIGIAGDRVYTGGTYTHNIFLELISGFGVIIGSLIIVIIGIVSITTLFSSDNDSSNLLLMWCCLGFIPLIVSGSYLTEFQFWIYLGLSVKFLKDLNKIGKVVQNDISSLSQKRHVKF